MKKGEIMKLSKKSIQKAKIELIDFSNCELSTKSYEESSMKKMPLYIMVKNIF